MIYIIIFFWGGGVLGDWGVFRLTISLNPQVYDSKVWMLVDFTDSHASKGVEIYKYGRNMPTIELLIPKALE